MDSAVLFLGLVLLWVVPAWIGFLILIVKGKIATITLVLFLLFGWWLVAVAGPVLLVVGIAAEANKTCPHCRRRLHPAASRCPHCGGNQGPIATAGPSRTPRVSKREAYMTALSDAVARSGGAAGPRAGKSDDVDTFNGP